MPELPEVEALVQDLSQRLAGRAVVRVDIAAFSCLMLLLAVFPIVWTGLYASTAWASAASFRSTES